MHIIAINPMLKNLTFVPKSLNNFFDVLANVFDAFFSSKILQLVVSG